MAIDRTTLGRRDVVIASAYGRGHWLATHLSEQGWSVSLVDYTSQLGEPNSDDYDGPFGLLETDLVAGSQKAIWENEFGPRSSVEVENGFSIWMKDGPLEGSGQLATFLSQEHSLSLSVRNYLHMVSDLSDIRLRNERFLLSKLPFENTWLARFMHSIHSNVLRENHLALENPHAAPFFAKYHLRSIKPGLHETALQFLRSKKVEVIDTQITAFENSGDESVTLHTLGGQMETRSFVWMLTSLETKQVSAHLLKQFYRNEEIEVLWGWQRFVVEFEEPPTEVPDGFVIMQDPHLPWTHTNVVVVRKKGDEWNCWLRLPSDKINDPDYQREQSSELALVIQSRIAWTSSTVKVTPAATPKWNLYSKNLKDKTSYSKNIFVSGPEHWDGIDPLSRFQAHRAVLRGLESIRKVWDGREAKREAKEAHRAAKQKERRAERENRD
jgi:hypothetical protein